MVIPAAKTGPPELTLRSLRTVDGTVHDPMPEILSRSSERDRFAPDPLSEVLQDLRLAGASYCRVELAAPWGIAFPAQRQARFHAVLEGHCWLRRAGPEPVPLEPGDAVLLPYGAGHHLADSKGGQTVPLEALPREQVGDTTYRLHVGGNGARALLVCSSVEFAEPNVHPLFALMPEALILRGATATDPTLQVLLETMAAEVSSQRIGAATVMARLADVVITRVVRAWAETQADAAEGWLAAMRDPHIGRALAAIHRRPGDDWSVTALANVAFLSRSTFSERFAAAVGATPARYVAWWRMHLASAWLRDKQFTVGEVAARLGYDSEAAFSRAFKRVVGVPPSTLRRPGALVLDRRNPLVARAGT